MIEGRVGVVVVTYNSLGYIDALMKSMAEAEDTQLEVRLIDNGSTDGTVEWLADYVQTENMPDNMWVTAYAFKDNTGFTHATNSGLKYMAQHTDIEYVALVNPDIILCEDWLTNQVPIFTENSTCGIIGCRQVHGAEIIHGGGQIYEDPRPLHEPCVREILPGVYSERMEQVCYSRFGHRRGHLNHDSWNVTETVPWVTFASVLLRKQMVEDIGYLDERFFNYCSDAEYCCRAWKKDWEVWYTANATVYHHVGASEKSGGQSVKDRKIADLRLFAQEEHEHGPANRK